METSGVVLIERWIKIVETTLELNYELIDAICIRHQKKAGCGYDDESNKCNSCPVSDIEPIKVITPVLIKLKELE